MDGAAGERLRARLRQLRGRRAQQHGRLGGARQRRRRHLAARQPRAGRDARRSTSAGCSPRRRRPARSRPPPRRAGFEPDADGVIHSPGRRAPAAGGRQVGQRQACRNGKRLLQAARARRSSSSSRTRCRSRSARTFDTTQGPRLADLGRRRQGRRPERLVLLRHLQGHPDQGRQADHRALAGRAEAELPEGARRRRRGGEEAQDAQAVGRRQGQVPHHAATSARRPCAARSGSSSTAATAR